MISCRLGFFFLRSFVLFRFSFFSAFDWLGKEIVQSRVRKKLVWLPPRWRSQHNTQNGREPPSTKTNNNNENIRERFSFSPTIPPHRPRTYNTTRKEGWNNNNNYDFWIRSNGPALVPQRPPTEMCWAFLALIELMGHDETSSFGCSFSKKIENWGGELFQNQSNGKWFLSRFVHSFVLFVHTTSHWLNGELNQRSDSNNQNVENVNRKKRFNWFKTQHTHTHTHTMRTGQLNIKVKQNFPFKV